MPKDIQCCFAVHVDAVAGWIGSYGGEDSPADISRGMFAGEVGSMRLLELFRRWGIRTSWFVPGHSAETFPDQMKRVADAGHEFGVHGYTHENPIALTPDQEEAILVKCIEVLIEADRARSHAATSRPGGSSAPPPPDCCSSTASSTTTACSTTTTRRTTCASATAGP